MLATFDCAKNDYRYLTSIVTYLWIFKMVYVRFKNTSISLGKFWHETASKIEDLFFRPNFVDLFNNKDGRVQLVLRIYLVFTQNFYPSALLL